MKMKLVSLTMLNVLFVSVAAAALDCEPKFYVGAESQLNGLRASRDYFVILANGRENISKKTKVGFGGIVGILFTENLGLEAGYSFLGSPKFTDSLIGVTDTIRIRNAHIEAMGYVPISCDMVLAGSLGVCRLTSKASSRTSAGTTILLTAEEKNLAKAKIGFRVGLGAEYKFDDRLSARLMVRHQKGNKLIKNINSANLGVFYMF